MKADLASGYLKRGATVAALEGLGRKVVLSAGGDGKGQDFSPLGPALAAHARALVLIGRDAMKIEAVVGECGIPVIHDDQGNLKGVAAVIDKDGAPHWSHRSVQDVADTEADAYFAPLGQEELDL